MSIKVTVNPYDPDTKVVLEDDRQVILDAEIEYSDGFRTRMTVYFHSTVLNLETGETSKTVTWEMPPATNVVSEQHMDMEGPPQ